MDKTEKTQRIKELKQEISVLDQKQGSLKVLL